MEQIYSFPPVSREDAKILILGSMPGIASLKANQYYAHPSNKFWPLMEAILDDGTPRAYEQRLELLLKNRIALWDVLDSCNRSDSSLDKYIKGEVANDFKSFLHKHQSLTHIFFNGKKAQDSFKKFVMPTIKDCTLICKLLPSTSPAHTITFEKKMTAWRQIKDI